MAKKRVKWRYGEIIDFFHLNHEFKLYCKDHSTIKSERRLMYTFLKHKKLPYYKLKWATEELCESYLQTLISIAHYDWLHDEEDVYEVS